MLYNDQAMAERLRPCRSIIVSEKNLPLLGTNYSYRDYEIFFQQELEPLDISTDDLLDEPESIVTEEEDEDAEDANTQHPSPNTQTPDDPLFNDMPQQQNSTYDEFDDDFWR